MKRQEPQNHPAHERAVLHIYAAIDDLTELMKDVAKEDDTYRCEIPLEDLLGLHFALRCASSSLDAVLLPFEGMDHNHAYPVLLKDLLPIIDLADDDEDEGDDEDEDPAPTPDPDPVAVVPLSPLREKYRWQSEA